MISFRSFSIAIPLASNSSWILFQTPPDSFLDGVFDLIAQSGALPIKTQAREFLFDLDNPQRAGGRCGNCIRDAAHRGLDQVAPPSPQVG
jgi:hypothetical protein